MTLAHVNRSIEVAAILFSFFIQNAVHLYNTLSAEEYGKSTDMEVLSECMGTDLYLHLAFGRDDSVLLAKQPDFMDNANSICSRRS